MKRIRCPLCGSPIQVPTGGDLRDKIRKAAKAKVRETLDATIDGAIDGALEKLTGLIGRKENGK